MWGRERKGRRYFFVKKQPKTFWGAACAADVGAAGRAALIDSRARAALLWGLRCAPMPEGAALVRRGGMFSLVSCKEPELPGVRQRVCG